ncbi:unnamed protein product [Diatraea saccharalis]|uniref:Uncharacterized protein n=1 Tax=Diatraea saccharalis TaxID=40085 RepID=A0A9N9R6M7_9NEOP|nr:unnamed protein product [Diatraea saccharalis]
MCSIDTKKFLKEMSKEIDKLLKRELSETKKSLQFMSDKLDKCKELEKKKNINHANKNTEAIEQRINETAQERILLDIEITGLPQRDDENIRKTAGTIVNILPLDRRITNNIFNDDAYDSSTSSSSSCSSSSSSIATVKHISSAPPVITEPEPGPSSALQGKGKRKHEESDTKRKLKRSKEDIKLIDPLKDIVGVGKMEKNKETRAKKKKKLKEKKSAQLTTAKDILGDDSDGVIDRTYDTDDLTSYSIYRRVANGYTKQYKNNQKRTHYIDLKKYMCQELMIKRTYLYVKFNHNYTRASSEEIREPL